MATPDQIREAVEYAKQNPTSSFARNLRAKIESGDEQIIRDMETAGYSGVRKVAPTPSISPYASAPTSIEPEQSPLGVRIAKGVGGALISSQKTLAQGIAATSPFGGGQGFLGSGADMKDEAKASLQQSFNTAITNAKKYEAGDPKRTKWLKLAGETAQLLGGNAQAELDAIPTTKQIVGGAAGTALDIATAGAYGAAAKGAKGGKLLLQGSKSAFAGEQLAKVGVKSSLGGNLLSRSAGLPSAVSNVAQGADKGLGLMRGAYQGAKAGIKTGAPIGAAYGVTSGLQNDLDAEGIAWSALGGGLTGGFLGGSLGGLGGGISGRSLSKRTQLAANKRTNELAKLEANYANLGTISSQAKSRGLDPAKILGETNYLTGMVDKNGHITTKQVGGAAERFTDDVIKPGEGVVYKLLEKEGATVPLTKAEMFLKQKVMASGLEGGALTRALKNVEDDVAGYALKAGKDGNIPVALLHNAKIDKTLNLNYLNPESKRIDKIIGNGLKELVENNSSVEVKKLNTELSKYYTLLSYIKSLHGKKVAGGKLGKYFSQTIGAVVGSHFGPLGAMAGAEMGGALRGQTMANKFSSPLGKKLEQSQMMKEAITAGNKPKVPKAPPLMLGMGTGGAQQQVSVPINLRAPTTYEAQAKSINYSSSLGKRKTTQRTTTIKTNSPIAQTVPQEANAVKGISKDLEPLVQEARKYKSAEEFVNQKTFNIPVDRIKPTNPDAKINFEKGGRSRSPGEPLQVVLKDGEIQIINGNHRYYEALSMGKKELPVSFVTEPRPSAIDIKSQLTDIYNQATKGAKTKSPTAAQSKSKKVKGPTDSFDPSMLGTRDRIKLAIKNSYGADQKKLQQALKNYGSPDGLMPEDVNLLHRFGMRI